MNYSLEKWDMFISKDMLPQSIQSNNERELEKLIAESWVEKENVRSMLVNKAFMLRKEKEMELYIQRHQAILIHLLEKVHSHKTVTAGQDNLSTFYTAIGSHLLTILDFIEQYFTKYFNQDENVPTFYLHHSLAESKVQVLAVKEKVLGSVPENEVKLCDIIFLDIEAFYLHNNIGKPVTYRLLIYYKAILDELANSTIFTTGYNNPLCRVLFYMNFNSASFIVYLLDKISAIPSITESLPERLEKLVRWQKLITIEPTRPSYALHSNFPSVKDSILHALEQEIKYQKALDKINNVQDSTTSKIQSPSSFIHTPYKGVEVYIFLRSMIDSDAVTNHTYSSFFEMLAPFIHNKQQKGFVSTSMIKYSGKVDESSKDNVKRLLQKMIRNIDSYNDKEH